MVILRVKKWGKSYFKSPIPVSPWENIRQSPPEEHSIKQQISTPQNCQGYQKQGESEKLSSRNAQGNMTTKCNAASWWDPGTKKYIR